LAIREIANREINLWLAGIREIKLLGFKND
jgi:hypothetical protein